MWNLHCTSVLQRHCCHRLLGLVVDGSCLACNFLRVVCLEAKMFKMGTSEHRPTSTTAASSRILVLAMTTLDVMYIYVPHMKKQNSIYPLYYIILYYIILYHIILYYIILYDIILYDIILYYIIMPHTVTVTPFLILQTGRRYASFMFRRCCWY